MAKLTPMRMTEQFEHLVRDLKESFWGDLYGQTRLAWKRFWEAESIRARDSYMKTGWYDQGERQERVDYRNGFYQRDFVTRLGTIQFSNESTISYHSGGCFGLILVGAIETTVHQRGQTRFSQYGSRRFRSPRC